jgi:addiction module HigA family antidote
MAKAIKKIAPIHPGEVLQHDFLSGMDLTAYRLAKHTGVPATRIGEILHGRRAITADTALRFGRYFGTTPEFWMNLQAHYDLEVARDELGARLKSMHEMARA